MQKIGYTDDDTDEADLQLILEEAHQDMIAGVGRNFVEDKRIRVQAQDDGELIEEYDLKFTPILEVDKILLNSHEQVDPSNYTVDKQNGSVTFDSDFVDDHLSKGQIIRFKYKPLKFKNIELWHAVHIAKNQELVQLEDSEQAALHENALRRARRLENQVNTKTGPGNATDGEIRRGTK
jgi:hypothetical protein